MNQIITLIVVLILIVLGIIFLSGNGVDTDMDDVMGEGGENMMEDEMMEEDEHMDQGSMEDGDNMEGEAMEEEAMNNGDEMMSTEFSGEVLAGASSPLINFNQADYEKALESDKLVVLYFFANWCPTCKVEVANGLYPAFNELESEGVVGFRVNYNDNQTDNNEKDLAREFGVAYQHTKVFLKNGERILKSPESWSKGRYLGEIKNSL